MFPLSVLESLVHHLGYLVLQTTQGPELGLALPQFLLVVVTADWISLDGYLGQSDDVEGFVQFSVAEGVGVHLVVPAT